MLTNEIHSVFPQLFDVQVDDLMEKRYSDMSDYLKDLVNKAYRDMEEVSVQGFNDVMEKYGNQDAKKQTPFSDDNIMRTLERDILLQVIDSKWIDHLNNIDALKDSIGLVAYGQKDPLIEYKKEAFNLFNAMMSDIQSETVRHLFRARFGIQVFDEAQEVLDNIEISEVPQPTETELTRALKNSTPNYVEESDESLVPKVGRNDLCPCGSGLKYKKCCGKGKV